MGKSKAKDRSSILFRGTTTNFSESEFYCKCGCGTYKMLEPLVMRLQYARNQARIPFLINSGFRCEKHNEAVGGKADSWHLRGQAADICADPGRLRKYGVLATKTEIVGLIVPALLSAKFKRIGIYFDEKDLFIHVDDGNWNKSQPVMIWGG